MKSLKLTVFDLGSEPPVITAVRCSSLAGSAESAPSFMFPGISCGREAAFLDLDLYFEGHPNIVLEVCVSASAASFFLISVKVIHIFYGRRP